jgi:hypothetical protein
MIHIAVQLGKYIYMIDAEEQKKKKKHVAEHNKKCTFIHIQTHTQNNNNKLSGSTREQRKVFTIFSIQ